jgi:spore maturation protein CgeB
VEQEDGEVDLRVVWPDGKTWSLWGRRGANREEALAKSSPRGRLPVLLGSGIGRCLEILADQGPVVVVDAEAPLYEASGVRERFRDNPDVLWIDHRNPKRAEEEIRSFARERGLLPSPLKTPLHHRLDPTFYPALEARLTRPNDLDGETLFWRRARYPKFREEQNRVLLLSSPYFLYREIRQALSKLGVAAEDVDVGQGTTMRPGFVEDLLRRVLAFRPDFVLTVNHLGVDREGALADLLERLSLPLASWFVDSPHLILHRYPGLATQNTAVFTWDEETVAPLRRRGFSQAAYLPLAADTHVFRPGLPLLDKTLQADAGFVGDSMVSKAAERFADAAPTGLLARDYRKLAQGLAGARETAPADFLRRAFPEHAKAFEALPDNERKLSFEALLTWEATRVYRSDCVRRITEFDAVVAGDEHWKEVLPPSPSLRLASRLDYYQDLPRFYPGVKVNLNCTSRQMKSAVNQRVFDVPACGGFVLTDRQAGLEKLFAPGKEVAVFDHPEEIPDLVRHYLANKSQRRRLTRAARKRVLAEHTYEHRLKQLLGFMRSNFG